MMWSPNETSTKLFSPIPSEISEYLAKFERGKVDATRSLVWKKLDLKK